MKKIILFVYFIIQNIYCFGQVNDDVRTKLINMSNKAFDSVMYSGVYKLKDTTFLNDIFVEKIQSHQLVSKKSIECYIWHFLRKQPNSICSNNVLGFLDKLYDNAQEDYIKIHINDIYIEYMEELGSCRERYAKITNKKLEESIAYKIDKNVENDFNLMHHRFILADNLHYVLKEKDEEKTESILLDIVSQGIVYGHPEYSTKMYNEQVETAKFLLGLRKGDLKALENTSFESNVLSKVDWIKKAYIEELGGKYKTRDDPENIDEIIKKKFNLKN